MKKIIWTAALATAVDAIASDFQPQDETRKALANDIRSRAREMRSMRVGAELQPHHLDFVSCFRQRLADHYVVFTARDDFEKAWGDAYNG
jgi:hypothetical protein